MAELASHASTSTATIPLESNLNQGWDMNPDTPSQAASVPGSEPLVHFLSPLLLYLAFILLNLKAVGVPGGGI